MVLSLAIFAAAAVFLHALPWLQTKGSGPLLLGVAFVSTWIGGWRSGATVGILSGLLLMWFYEPAGHLAVSDPQDLVRLAIFVAVTAITCGMLVAWQRALESTKLAQRRLVAALAAARMGAWERNLRTGSFWWSSGLEDIFGRRPATFVPTYEGFLDYIHPDDRQFLANAVTSSVENGTEFEIEHRIVQPDLGVKWVVTRGRIIHGDDGTPERVLGIAVDITERKASEGNTHHADEPLTAFPGRL
jgi:PAS domain S-box-containing protein